MYLLIYNRIFRKFEYKPPQIITNTRPPLGMANAQNHDRLFWHTQYLNCITDFSMWLVKAAGRLTA